VRLGLFAAALVLAGCGGASVHARSAAPAPPPALAKRCGSFHSHARTFWFTAADGTRLDGAELGSGPRGVILLHESPADLCGWAPYGASLARRGFHVLLVDLRAYGLSARGPYGGKRGAIADVRGSVTALRRLGARRVALVGASYGAVNALVAAPALGHSIDAVASLSGELDLNDGEFDSLAAVRRIGVPLLLLGSREDRYLDEADARRLVRAAREAPERRLVEFPGSYHGWDLLDTSPQHTRADRVLVAFLRRVTQ
jgi:pimeloyl-ACP methyl ester carboxylesterase